MELLERKKLNSRNRKFTVSPSSALKDFIIERNCAFQSSGGRHLISTNIKKGTLCRPLHVNLTV